MRRHALRDTPWQRLDLFLPNRGQNVAPWQDQRTLLHGRCWCLLDALQCPRDAPGLA
jgi:hypothetical protein